MLISPDEKQRILNYSRDKFLSEGFYKITMDELAREMHISKKTIYKHFQSKEILVREISDDFTDKVHKEVTAIADGDGDTIVKFCKIMNFYRMNILSVDDKWYKDLQMYAPHIWHDVNRLRTDKMYTIMAKMLKQGKKEKLIEDYPNEIIIGIFIAAVREIISPDFILRNKFSMKQAASHTFSMLINAILTKSGKEQYRKTSELIIQKNFLYV